MAATEKVHLLGDSLVSPATHDKGRDQFSSVTFPRGADPSALMGSAFDVCPHRRPMPLFERAGYAPLRKNLLGWVTKLD